MTGSNGSGQTQQKPVTIDYSSGPDHTVIFELIESWGVQPLVTVKFTTCRVDAAGEDKSASESFSRTLWGVGASYRNITPYATADVWFAAGDRYSKVEGTLSAPLWSDIGLRIGGFYEHMDMGELRVRNTGFLLGGVIQW